MRLRVLSLELNTGAYSSFVETICKLAASKVSSYVCVANVHMLVEAHKSDQFAAIVKRADLVTPDGMPLCNTIKWLYGKHQDRVAGMDLLPDLLKEAESKGLNVFFYGGTEQMLSKTDTYLKEHFPNLNVVGLYSPPFRDLTAKEDEDVVKMINSRNTNLVLVALGCPKQETWMGKMKDRVNGCMIGIGGALPVMVEIQKRAPEWMQKNSLEWLFRLFQEPRRLLTRYVVTNSVFIWLLFKQLLKQGFKKKKVKESGPFFHFPATREYHQV